MKRLNGQRVTADFLKSHHHVCDLVVSDYPLLSLYTDGRLNWLYLWCDTKGDRNRWLVFRTTRELLINYLEKEEPLLTLIKESNKIYALEEGAIEYFETEGGKKKRTKRILRLVSVEEISEYMPSDDSYFDDELTNDLDFTKQLVPSCYDLNIDGSWFGQDFEHLFKRYERIYAFFYATRPQFVTTIGSILERCLKAPWMGGASRVHLYSQLAKQIPAIHSLRVRRLEYASPGEINFEAIASIGESIAKTTALWIKNEAMIRQHSESIQALLTKSKLNKRDLSNVADDSVPLDSEKKVALNQACASIAELMNVRDEFTSLDKHSPNVVVFSKAVQSFVRQVARLAIFQDDGMVSFEIKT